MLKIPLPKSGFNLEVTLDSGQVFGWAAAGPVEDFFSRDTLEIPAEDFSLLTRRARPPLADTVAARRRQRSPEKKSSPPAAYAGLIKGRKVTTAQINGHLCVDNADVRDDIIHYFDLNFDLSPVYKYLKSEPKLEPAYRSFKGLRLINQDPWEALACFIISSNNNVKRIQGIWRNLSEYYLPKTGDTAFPSAKQIAKTHERILRQLGLGYRAPFLLHTAQFISTSPQCLDMIRESGYEEARERVLAFPGIGPKVADCVLLYGFHKLEAFPVDVWILRAIRKLYFKNRKVSEDKVHRFGQKKWGPHAGYVQQYIFHGIRNGIL